MTIDWSNGLVTIQALSTDPGFLLLILGNSILAVILGILTRKAAEVYKKENDVPYFTLIPLLIIFFYFFIFSEATQYYYLRPIAYYFLFLFATVALLAMLFLPKVSAKRQARKLKKTKTRQ